jgi:hypothetical protein
MEEIKKGYAKHNVEFVNFEILDMNAENFIRRGDKGAKVLKKLINTHEVSWGMIFI